MEKVRFTVVFDLPAVPQATRDVQHILEAVGATNLRVLSCQRVRAQ